MVRRNNKRGLIGHESLQRPVNLLHDVGGLGRAGATHLDDEQVPLVPVGLELDAVELTVR